MKKRIYEKGKEYVSVSQYTTAKSCNLKWFLKNVAYVKYAQSAGAELGSHWHTLVEDYIAGKDIEPNLIKAPTFRKVFEKNPWFFEFLGKLKGVHVEKSVDYTLPCGTIFIGDVDIIARNTKVIIQDKPKITQGVAGNTIIDSSDIGKVLEVKYVQGHTTIIDWKTMSSWNYALDSEKLSRDDQVLIYGKTQKETREVIHVQINHRESAIKFVAAPFNRDKAIMVEGNINAMAIEMSAMRKQEIGHIKKNRNHCSAYGGCPNLPFCNGKETLEQLKERVKPKEALNNEAKVTERLDGLRKELGKENLINDAINTILRKEPKMGFAEMLAAKKANAEAEAKKQLTATVMPVAPKVETVAAPVVAEAPVVVKEKKIKKVKEPVEVQGELNLPPLPENEPAIKVKDIPHGTLGMEVSVKKVMATIVCINSLPARQPCPSPSEIFRDEIKDILKAHNIQCLGESKFNEAAKLLYKIQDDIKKSLYRFDFVTIDTRRIADATILDMLYDDDRFILIGGKF